jgi:hypothetical protein
MALAHIYASGADLPPELYPLIIQNITHASDLKVASLVCSHWQTQAQRHLFRTLHLPKNMKTLISLSNDIRDNHAILSGVETIEIPDPMPPQMLGDFFEAVNNYIISLFESRNQPLCAHIERTAEVLDGGLIDRLVGRTRDSESVQNQNTFVDPESNLGIATHHATASSCISTIRLNQPLIYGLTSDIFDTLGPSFSGLSLTESCSMTRANLNGMGGNRLEEFQNAMVRQLERDWTEEAVEKRKVRRLAVDADALGVRVRVRVSANGGAGAGGPGAGPNAPLCIALRHLNYGALEKLVVQWHYAVGLARAASIVEHFFETVAGNVKELKLRIYSKGDMISGPQDDRLLRECPVNFPWSMRY